MIIFYKIIKPFVFYKPWRKRLKERIKNDKIITKLRRCLPNIEKGSFQIVECNMGEAVIYALTSECWYDGGTVLGTKKYHKEIFKMICPNIPFLLLPSNIEIPFTGVLKTKRYEFSFVLRNSDLGQMNLTRTPFFFNWQKYLGKDLSKIMYPTPVISKEAEKSALQKLKKMGLSLNKLIFLSEEALSLNPLPEKFWESIKEKIKSKNMQFFVNKSKGNTDEVLTVEEAYFVANNSKMIIALRSGLIDLLCLCKVPLRIIYGVNNFYGDIQRMYTLTVFPFCHKDLVEYNINNTSVEDIQNQLIKEIDNILK